MLLLGTQCLEVNPTPVLVEEVSHMSIKRHITAFPLRQVYGPLVAGVLFLGTATLAWSGEPQPPYQATGFKVGEVSDSGAIVWTRLTSRPHRNPPDGPQTELVVAGDEVPKKAGRKGEVRLPPSLAVGDLRDATPGTKGEVRAAYRTDTSAGWQFTAWEAVDPERDFTRQIPLAGLRPNAQYELRVESRAPGDGPAGQSLEGRFHTAPAADQAAPATPLYPTPPRASLSPRNVDGNTGNRGSQLVHSGLGDLCTPYIQLLKAGQPGQMREAAVVDLCAGNGQILKLAQRR